MAAGEEQRTRQKQIDLILDAALDELDEDDENDDYDSSIGNVQSCDDQPVDRGTTLGNDNQDSNTQHAPSTAPAAEMNRSGPDPSEGELNASLEDMMKHLLQAGKELGVGDSGSADEEALDSLIRRMQSHVSSELLGGESPTGMDTPAAKAEIEETAAKSVEKSDDEPPASKRVVFGPEPPPVPASPSERKGGVRGVRSDSEGQSDVDRTVSKILDEMAKAGASSEGTEAAQVEGMGEEMMEDMMKEFEKMGEKGDADDVIDGMMRQLLSKELMYEPMKQVTERFPRWLAESKEHLSDEDYNRYGHQYQYFQRIVRVYDTDPDNFPRLMELMQDIQEYGQPPADIIKELAPGLEFDEEGLPKMDGGIPNMPFPGNEQCVVM